MSRRRRFLFVVPPSTGHVNRVQAVATELAARGHRVAWFGQRRELRPFLPKGARLLDVPSQPYEHARSVLSGRAKPEGPIALELGVAAVIATEIVIDDFRPDAIVVDRLGRVGEQLTVAGPLAARRRSLPWATSMRGADATPYAGPPAADTSLPGGVLGAEVQRVLGLEPMEWPFDSPDLVLVFSTPALLGGHSTFPSHYRLVGPALGPPRIESTSFPWEELLERPRVLVSLGSVIRERGQAFYAAVVDALGGRNTQVIVSAPPDVVPPAPPNILVRSYVPQLTLLPHLDAVVCHGGHNTVSETLAQGLPLVLAPISADQPENSRQVADAGAGLVVRFDDVTAGELREAVTAVLTNARYREAAERVKASFEAAGGARAAADALEQLVT